MGPYGVRDVAAVPAGDRHDDRQAYLAAGAEDQRYRLASGDVLRITQQEAFSPIYLQIAA